MNKKGDFDYIPYAIGFMAILIVVAVLMVILSLVNPTDTESEDDTQETPSQNSRTTNPNISVTVVGSEPIQEKYTPSTLSENDCLVGETYDSSQKLCVLVCENCDQNSINKKANALLKSFYDSNSTEIIEHKIIPLASYVQIDGELEQTNLPLVSQLSLQRYVKNESYHYEPWLRITDIFPMHQIPYLKEYHVVSDMQLPTFTLIKLKDKTFDEWELYLDVRSAYQNKTFDDRVIHSFLNNYGILLALDPNQITRLDGMVRPPTAGEAKILQQTCEGYFSQLGCMKQGSYLSEFYTEFWASTYTEYLNSKDVPSKLSLYHDRYRRNFVTDLALQSPEQDFAQSWSVFVLSEEPKGSSIKDQKVAFFYNYPQFTRLRDWIRSRI